MTSSNHAAADVSPALSSLPPGVHLTNLPNGLTLIIREDHSAPVVSAQAWCKAGSIDEGRWLGAGLSHILEHMLFKGTKTRPGSRIDQEIQDAGGYMNAYTSFDRTVYWINVPNTGAAVAIDILCDIMQHATLPPEEMAKEKDVIRREMDMNQDDPSQRSARRLFETAYTKSPYRFTIIGYPDIYDLVQREDVLNYYQEKYAPNNLVFVVVGDVKTEEVEKQIRQAFAQSKSRALPSTVLPMEPRQTAPRDLVEEAPIELGHVHMSWHIPDLRHPDVPLLDVLGTLLGSGRSSRLYRKVREEQALVHAIDAWTYSPGNPGLFGSSALVDPDKFLPARQATLDQIERLKNELIRPDELAKAVRQFTAWTLSSRKTMQGQAQDLGGNWVAAHDLNFSARYLEAVKRITPADLQRVAQLYLTEENRTLYALLPEGSAPKTVQVSSQYAEHPVQLITLPNGLRLLLKEDHRLPFVEFRAVFKGGLLAETYEKNGITQLMAKMLLQGTKQRSAEQIALEIESLGGSIESYGGNNSFGVSIEVLNEDVPVGLDLLTDVLRQPTFPAEALERERQIQLANIKAQRDELLPSATRLMREALFGPNGYGLHSLGHESSVQAIRRSDLEGFHRALAAPNNGVLAIFGAIQSAEILKGVQTRLGDWKPSQSAAAPPPSSATLTGVHRVSDVRDKKQAVLVIGFHGTSLAEQDRYPLELIQEACSDLGSRLFVRIRDNLGLAYYVGAHNFLGLVPGYFAFYVGTEPSKVALVEEELLKEAELLRKEGLSPEELQRAKAKIIGQKKIARQDLGHFAMNSALDELYGLGYAHADTEDALYQAVNLDQIKVAANKHLRTDAFVVSVVQPPSGDPIARPGHD